MKSTIHIEFTDEELRKHAEDLGRRWIVHLLSMVGRTISEMDPQGLQGAMQYMQQMLHTGIQYGVRYAQHQQQHHHHPPYGTAPGPMTSGPFGGGTYGPPGSNVRPMRGEPAELQRCFPIEATRHSEAAWCCHHCATANGLARPTCRHCGHPRCDAIVAPPRDNEPPRVPPQPPEPAS